MKTTTHLFIRTAVASLLFFLGITTTHASGISQKQLAVNLTFEKLTGDQPNFDLQSFSVVNGVLTANGTITWTVAGVASSMSFQLPVLDVQGDCDVLNIQIAGISLNVSGTSVGFDQVDFDIYSGPITSPAVRSLLCTAGHLANAGANFGALADALIRILPAIE